MEILVDKCSPCSNDWLQPSFLFGMWMPFPHRFFTTTPVLITTHFCFTLLRTVTSVHGQRPVMQPAETFLMSQCNIEMKANRYCMLYLGISCSTIELAKIFSYYLFKLKSDNSICLVGKWRDTNSTWQNLDWKTTVDWFHWKWLHFQLVILNWRGIQQPNSRNSRTKYRNRFRP